MFFCACEREKIFDSENKNPGILGKVTNQSQQSLPGVGAHYIFLDQNYQEFPVVRNPQLQFTLSDSQNVTLIIFNMFNVPVDTLIESQMLPSGVHAIIFEGTGFPNGVYRFEMKGETDFAEGDFYILTYDMYKPNGARSLTQTDSDGIFYLSAKSLAIGMSFTDIFGTKMIADSVLIVLVKENYSILTEKIKVDTSEVSQFFFSLNPQK